MKTAQKNSFTHTVTVEGTVYIFYFLPEPHGAAYSVTCINHRNFPLFHMIHEAGSWRLQGNVPMADLIETKLKNYFHEKDF